jgi:hypothetical protein
MNVQAGASLHSTTDHRTVYLHTGTLNFLGAWSIPAGKACKITEDYNAIIVMNGMVLSNYGTFVIGRVVNGFTDITQGTGTITNMISTAQAAGYNCTLTVTGPTLPTAANVLKGSGNYGYASALVTPSGGSVLLNPGLSGGLR